MSAAEVCQYCGHENQVGWKYCSQCGKSRNPSTAAKPFSELLDIHPQADLIEVLKDILKWEREDLDEWAPTVDQLKEACERELTENQRQCLYRRYQLHLAGSQPIVSAESIARERGASGTATMWAIRSALSNLNISVRNMIPAEVKELRLQRYYQGSS